MSVGASCVRMSGDVAYASVRVLQFGIREEGQRGQVLSLLAGVALPRMRDKY